jgi:uncharacterized heparinase superfamily protein
VTGEELAQLGRTAAHLRPAQVAHRARLRAQRTALRRFPQASQRLLAGGPVPDAATPGWPLGFAPLDATALTVTVPRYWPDLPQLRAGQIQLLGITRRLGEAPGWFRTGADQVDWAADWRQADAPQLWRFHLHYWDWAWGLAAEPDRAAARDMFALLWRSWQASCTFGSGDAWLPYPAALRAWSWCGIYRDLVAGSDLEAEFRRGVAAHAGFLRRHLESDVGGNHLIKDLKALAGLGVFLGDDAMLRRALRLLTSQLAVQVLADGGHYERAPAYHCQVLGDLIDIADLLNASGRAPAPALTLAIARMRRWLGAILAPDGGVPLLNDGYPVPGALVAALRPRPAPDFPLLVLPDTGLIRAAVGEWQLLADVGAPCPDELPAHAHADTLSCLVHVGGVPLLVDTGTSTYAAGPVRSYERSTAAHNTLEIDGADSTEVWGAFRAGRRARVYNPVARLISHGASDHGASSGRMIARASHDGYRHLRGRPWHRRRWLLTSGGLQVDDEVTGDGRHEVIVRWHLVPGSVVRLQQDHASVTTTAGKFEAAVTGTTEFWLGVESAPIATGFLRTVAAPVLTCRVETMLPVRLSTSWHRISGDVPGPRRPA